MKALCFIVIIIMLGIPGGIIAQCGVNTQTITYDTTVIGNGGDGTHNFSFPKFNIPTGTLLEVQFRSEVALSFGFKAENTYDTSLNYRVRVGRADDINSAALTTPILFDYPTRTYGFFPLARPDGTPGSGPDFREEPVGYALNHVIRQQTVNNTADYLGLGNVAFEYNTVSFTSTPTGTSFVTLDDTSADTLNFRITYVYCLTSILAADISLFTAKKRDEKTVDINWINNKESETYNYILEKSADGKTFQYVEKFTALAKENQTGNYQYQYHPLPGEKGKIIFRLKQIEKDGTVKYSPLRVVELSKNEVLARVYPNPSNGPVNIMFHNTRRSDWIVEVITISGQLVESNFYKNALIGRMNFQNKLKKGTYLLKIIEKRSEKQSIHKLIIR